MAPRQYVSVKPDLLKWARATAGFTLEEAARKIGVKPDRLSGWEAGEAAPTASQLRNAAKVFKRPLGAFFLPAPPEEPQPPHDFRRLYGEDPGPPSPPLLLELRRARRRRALALELYADLEVTVQPFPLRAAVDADAEAVAERVRDWLGVSLAEQMRWRRAEVARDEWIAALERHDVLVFQTGGVEPGEMRGFSLGERALPVIALNAKDVRPAQIFTLLHELVHLTLDQGGLCNPERVRSRGRTADERLEVFCNRVAGAILVPAPALLEQPDVASVRRAAEWPEDTIRQLAARFAVSREVILRRLLILGRTTEAFYQRKRAEYIEEYQARAAAAAEEESHGFAPFYRLVVRNNGRRYTQLVLEALKREQITPADVSDYLGVRLKHLENIADAIAVNVEG
jgi:Zn-dependent peptidase ImmA (M78 family)/DNA-binding XRE family transcriptional regulator